MVQPRQSPRATATLLLGALALWGCGELNNPDLEHGAVAGRIVGAAVGGSVYPLGRPDLKVALAPDGGFELAELPVGEATLVLFDGSTPGRAELVRVQVAGARRSQVTRYGEAAAVSEAQKMPLAGVLVAAALPTGGALPAGARMAVKGTDRSGVAGADGLVTLGPLPAGQFALTARMDGYRLGEQAVDVAAGATSGYEVALDIEAGQLPGCAAGSQCRNGLRCRPEDGRCYQCLADADCGGAPGSCDVEAGLCQSEGGAQVAVCAACTGDAQCGGGGCFKAPGAASGFCTRVNPVPAPDQCTGFECPAGFACQADGTERGACVPLQGCATYFSEFGEGCFRDDTCGVAHGIQDGFCLGANRLEGRAGYCTAPCRSNDDCLVAGFTCDTVSLHACVRTPP